MKSSAFERAAPTREPVLTATPVLVVGRCVEASVISRMARRASLAAMALSQAEDLWLMTFLRLPICWNMLDMGR